MKKCRGSMSCCKVVYLFLICSLVLCVFTGCNKFTKDIADAKKPADSPEYTVQYDKNVSPAEGQSRKP